MEILPFRAPALSPLETHVFNLLCTRAQPWPIDVAGTPCALEAGGLAAPVPPVCAFDVVCGERTWRVELGSLRLLALHPAVADVPPNAHCRRRCSWLVASTSLGRPPSGGTGANVFAYAAGCPQRPDDRSGGTGRLCASPDVARAGGGGGLSRGVSDPCQAVPPGSGERARTGGMSGRLAAPPRTGACRGRAGSGQPRSGAYASFRQRAVFP